MKLHHVGIAVREVASYAADYSRAFGVQLVTAIVDDPVQKVRVALADAGDGVFVEFVEPMGPDSPVHGVLKRGGGPYHVCYLVDDIEAAIARVRSAGGVLVSGPSPAPLFDGRPVAFVYTRDRALVEFLQQ